MLTNSKEILKLARKNGFAIGGFNTSDLEITQAILEAANEMNSAVLVQTSQKAIEFAGAENLFNIVKTEADKYDIPVVLHLDHGTDLKIIKKCLEIGWTSVMFDGSKLPYEENVRLTQQVAVTAHGYDASVEAEVGKIGGIEDDIYHEYTNNTNCTNPEEAKQFVAETGIDSLAIAFGNSHGVPDPQEKLNFDILEQTAKLVSIPLVFHGASSTPVEDMKRAISLGIAKVNIDTDIRLAFSGAIRDFMAAHPSVYDPREIMGSAKEAVKKVVLEKIKLFRNK